MISNISAIDQMYFLFVDNRVFDYLGGSLDFEFANTS